MNHSLLKILLLALAVLTSTASAQWKTETYQLKGGWNAIYIHGDASIADFDELLVGGAGANIDEVWRWNSNSTPIQFTQSPQVQTPGSPEWSVWRRNDQVNATLTKFSPQSAYLIRCAGTASDSYQFQLPQIPLAPKTQWVREGANLLSFQTKRSSPPTFSNFFTAFPAPIATGSDVFQYRGGDLSSTNPLKIFSPISEPLKRNQAYWFESEVVSDFHGPIKVDLRSGGLFFNNEGSLIKLKLTNLTNQASTITLTPSSSGTPPTGARTITGPVPLALRNFNPETVNYEHTPLSGPLPLEIPPGESIELNFVIDSTDPAVAAAQKGDYFGSLLTITDANGIIEYDLPATFEKGSKAGLWLGNIDVTHVPYTPKARAEVTAGQVTEIQMVGRPAAGYDLAPAIRISPPPAGGTPATAEATVNNGKITAFTITNAGSGYEKPPGIRIDAPPAAASIPVPKPMRLRILMHRTEDGNFRLLSQAYLGQLANSGGLAICTSESLLDPSQLASASRFTVAHLPLNTNTLGTTGGNGALTYQVDIPFNDPTNPFVHQYHPDHDNLDARFENQLPAGNESPNITRALTFTFTPENPAGITPLGWGTTILGGSFSETISGVHSDPITLQGTFQLQRISEIPTITIPN